MVVSFRVKKGNAMANIDELTVDIIAHPCIKMKEEPKEIWDSSPMGKESVKRCIKDIGQYIIDNAEKIAENIDKTVVIDINCNISVGCLPEVQVSYTNRLTKSYAKSEKEATTEK